MKRNELAGKRILPGLWKLGERTYLVRVQVRGRGRVRNRRRLLENATLADAIHYRDALKASLVTLTASPRAVLLSAAPAPVAPVATPCEATHLELVGAFASSWLERKIARGDLAESTADRYAVAMDRVSDRILQSPLDVVTEEMIETWLIAARREGFKPTTINGWLSVLRQVFAASPLEGNPATNVKPLKVPTNLEEPNALPPEQLKRLLRALRGIDPTLESMAWVQAITGMRWQEVSALYMTDLDFERGVILIRRKVSRRKIVPTTKTNKARTVGLPPILASLFEAQHTRRSDDGYTGPLVFPSSVGKPILNSRMSSAMKKARERAGISQTFTSHGFRRSVTDMLRQSGVDSTTSAAIIGHDTERMRRHYSTVDPSEVLAASEKLAELLEG